MKFRPSLAVGSLLLCASVGLWACTGSVPDHGNADDQGAGGETGAGGGAGNAAASPAGGGSGGSEGPATGGTRGDAGSSTEPPVEGGAAGASPPGQGGAAGSSGPGGVGGGGAGGAGNTGGPYVLDPRMQPAIMAVGYGGMRIVSFDEGKTWRNRAVIDPNGGDDSNLIRAVGYAEGVWIGVGWKLFRSTDGIAWTEISDRDLPGGWFDCVTFQNGTFIVKVIRSDAGGQNGTTLTSTDRGLTWKEVKTSKPVCNYQPQPFPIGTAQVRSEWRGQILRSSDQGKSWIRVLNDCCGIDDFAAGFAIPGP